MQPPIQALSTISGHEGRYSCRWGGLCENVACARLADQGLGAQASASSLQGHCNSISCLASTEDRSTIITADIGNESLLVLWDARTGNPVKSIPQPHSYGITALDVSPGGEWLATVGAPHPSTGEQEVGGLHSTASRRDILQA